MTRLRNLVAAALVTLSIAALNTSAAESVVSPEEWTGTQQTTHYCWVFFMGRWWEIPC